MNANKLVLSAITVCIMLLSCTQTGTNVQNQGNKNDSKGKIQSYQINDNLIATDRYKQRLTSDCEYKQNEELKGFDKWVPEKSSFNGILSIKGKKLKENLDIYSLFQTPEGYCIFDGQDGECKCLDTENLSYKKYLGQLPGFYDKEKSINIQAIGAQNNYLLDNDFNKVVIACIDYKNSNRFWDIILRNKYAYSSISIIGDVIIIILDNGEVFTCNIKNGKILNLFTLEAILNYSTDKYLWCIVEDSPEVGQDYEDPSLKHIIRYNPESNEINELKFEGTRRLFYVSNKLYVGDVKNKLHEINEDTGDIINTFDLNSKLGNINKIFQDDNIAPNSAIEIRDGEEYYLYKPDNLVKIGKYQPIFVNEYYIETEESFFGLDEDSGERTWEIKKSQLKQEAKILAIDSRGILVVDKSYLYVFRP